MDILKQHLHQVARNGVAQLAKEREQKVNRSATDKMANGTQAKPNDELPLGPGFSYMTHLFQRQNLPDKIKANNNKAGTNDSGIMTEADDALKSALRVVGLYSERNPHGIPLDLKNVKKFWFGEKEVDGLEETQWRTTIEQGDSAIDPKKVRKFANYDGSLTWEVLNDDKTVMSRFTMGEYNGKSIFAQGGYDKFSDMLKKVKAKVGPDYSADFDAVRGMF